MGHACGQVAQGGQPVVALGLGPQAFDFSDVAHGKDMSQEDPCFVAHGGRTQANGGGIAPRQMQAGFAVGDFPFFGQLMGQGVPVQTWQAAQGRAHGLIAHKAQHVQSRGVNEGDATGGVAGDKPQGQVGYHFRGHGPLVAQQASRTAIVVGPEQGNHGGQRQRCHQSGTDQRVAAVGGQGCLKRAHIQPDHGQAKRAPHLRQKDASWRRGRPDAALLRDCRGVLRIGVAARFQAEPWPHAAAAHMPHAPAHAVARMCGVFGLQRGKQPVDFKNFAISPLTHAPGRAVAHFFRRRQDSGGLFRREGCRVVVGQHKAAVAGHGHKHDARLFGRFHEQGLQAAKIIGRAAEAGAPARLQCPDQGLGPVHHIVDHGRAFPLAAADGKHCYGGAQNQGHAQQHPRGQAA